MTTLPLTRHAAIRLAQRSIRLKDADLIALYSVTSGKITKPRSNCASMVSTVTPCFRHLRWFASSQLFVTVVFTRSLPSIDYPALLL